METPLGYISQIETILGNLKASLQASTPSSPTIFTADGLGRALAAAKEGDVLLLDASLVFSPALELRMGIELRSAFVGDGRMNMTDPAPRFLNGISVISDVPVTLSGIEVHRQDPNREIVSLSGIGHTIRRGRVLGDNLLGGKRGVAANAERVSILDSRIDHCFHPGTDAQAVYIQDSLGNLLIENCWLAASGQAVMSGGGDPSDEAHLPAGIVIRKSTLTKRPEWRMMGIKVKNVFELKNAKHVLVEDCELSECWGGGQDGYLIMLTPRNQDGTAPYSTVEDVTIRNCRGGRAAAAIDMLGTDDNYPSERMRNITITGCNFGDLDPVKYAGSNRMIIINDAPEDVTIENNSFAGSNIGSVVYFNPYGSQKCKGLTIRGNTWPTSTYGVFGDNASVGHAWEQYVEPDGVLSDNTIR